MATDVNVYSKVVGLMSQVLSGVQANIMDTHKWYGIMPYLKFY